MSEPITLMVGNQTPVNQREYDYQPVFQQEQEQQQQQTDELRQGQLQDQPPTLQHHQSQRPTLGDDLDQAEEVEYDESKFKLSTINWLFLSILFYCTVMSIVILQWCNLNFYISNPRFQMWAAFIFDFLGCAGAIVFGLILTTLKPCYTRFHRWFIPSTILLTLTMTVVASIVVIRSHTASYVWGSAFVSNFFLGGCVVIAMTLLGWNTKQRNSPFWFGLVGGIRGVVSYNLLNYKLNNLVVFIPLWCVAFGLFVWVVASHLKKRSRVLVPYYINHGQRLFFSNTLWLVYLGLGLMSLFIALYDIMLVRYLTHDRIQTLDNYFNFYEFDSLAFGCGLSIGGLGVGLHRWGL